jgi:predicted dehydrogenase
MPMATKIIGIILNGATGRIASTQHLANALMPIRNEGGLRVNDDRALRTPGYTVFFDAAATHQRAGALEKTIAAGKHVYSEKPVAPSVAEGLALLRAVEARGLKHGAVEDKQYLPGLRNLAHVVQSGALGRIVGFRLEFGWWVFDGSDQPCQRPSWNYRRANCGGLIIDMYPHWRYLIENMLGRINRIVSVSATATPERIDERSERYAVDVEDSAATLVELHNGAIGTIRSSWATRVRDDLLVLQVDGMTGSALANTHHCYLQTSGQTPKISQLNIAGDLGGDYRGDWTPVATVGPDKNPYRIGWEEFLRHVVGGAPPKSNFVAGIRDVQLAEACHRSMKEKSWISFGAGG